MITRSLYLAAGWFAISLAVTLFGGYRSRRSNIFASAIWLIVVIMIGDFWAYFTFGILNEIRLLSLMAFIFGMFWIVVLPDWNASGHVTWAMTVFATIIFVLYSFMVTAFTPLNTISFVIALDFFMLEAIALLMALTHAYESLELFCRFRWRRTFDSLPPNPDYTPMVSLHVPAYNEPPEVVEATLHSLARLDYPNYEVLVVDNNTPGEENWQKIRNLCLKLGPKFRFVHLDKWPGYKSGALNFALAHTAQEAEIIGSIDADYIVDRGFLRALVPAFADPTIGFVQAPQDYRDHDRDPFAESTYHGYKYFFEVSMPVRNEHNAIIFCGTMGLIRKSALQEVGGWDEWCITEDAEASLRILKRGYNSLYVKHSYGHGLMPYTFEGLKKQRFRWCFGGIQILKKHWSALMPWGHWLDPENHLTGAQRYFYLVGGLQWFTDVLNLVFGFFLSLGAVASIFYGIFSIRPLTGPLLIIPAVFLFLHMWRFLWVLRQALQLRLRVAIRSMYNFFSLGWAVTLACIQGLIRKRGVFLRTPKSHGTSRMWDALRVTQWETMIGLIFVGFGMAAYIARPGFKTLWLALLLGWQASLFLAAPYFSLLSVRVMPAPNMRQPSLDRGIAVAENSTARWAWATLMVFVAFVWLAFQIPLPKQPPTYSQFQPPEVPPQLLLGIQPANVTPTPAIPPTETPTALFIPPTLGYPTATVTVLPTITSTVLASPTVTLIPPTTVVPPTLAASPTLPAPTDTAPPPTATAVPPTNPAPTLIAPTPTP